MAEPIVPSDVVQAIKDSVKTESIEMNGELYLSQRVHLPPAESMPSPLKLTSLSGLVGYVANEQGPIQAIHVEDYRTVSLIGPLTGRYRQRPVYVRCRAVDGRESRCLDSYVSAEEFIIGLQSIFVQTPMTKLILRLVGNLRSEAVKTATDDGVTQTVGARTGVVMVEEVEVPNPVTLQPFRTFPDIDQPEVRFILRVRDVKDGIPQIGLFETSDFRWQGQTVDAIHEWLLAQIENVPIIA